MATRSTDYLCAPTDGIKGSKLPLKEQALSFFPHLHIKKKNIVRDSATIVVNHVLEFRENASIPIIQKNTVISNKHHYSLKKGKTGSLLYKSRKKVILLQNYPICLIQHLLMLSH